VLGGLLKRAFNALVLGLAALTFFVVPVGKKTAAQHFIAIFTTKPAKEAGRAISGTAKSVAADVEAKLQKMRAKPGDEEEEEESPSNSKQR
jgi:hypothetical protein